MIETMLSVKRAGVGAWTALDRCNAAARRDASIKIAY